MDDKVKEFLNELKTLRDKYGIEIHGCGCCPALYYTSGEIISEELRYNDGKYEIDDE